MNLSRVTNQIEANLPGRLSDVHWTRSVGAGTLLTSAILLVTGRRKAALAVAAAGTVIALMEDPEAVRRFWGDIPSYVQAGQKLLARVEGLVEQVADQGGNFRDILRRR